MSQSIKFARVFTGSINYRPTIMAFVKKASKDSISNYVDRLKKVQLHYLDLIKEDKNNKVLGDPRTFFKLYYKTDIDKLKKVLSPEYPSSQDDWMIPFAKNVDCSLIKFPVILIQEPGIN